MADTLGKRITELRRRKGITQDNLAEAMEVSSQAVSKWENDLSCPDISLLPRLADYFHVTIDELLRGEIKNSVVMVPDNERKDINQLVLRLRVEDGEDRVKINLPLGMLKVLIDAGLDISQYAGTMSGEVSGAIQKIDFAAILSMAESGLIGKLVEVDSGSSHVEIYVE